MAIPDALLPFLDPTFSLGEVSREEAEQSPRPLETPSRNELPSRDDDVAPLAAPAAVSFLESLADKGGASHPWLFKFDVGGSTTGVSDESGRGFTSSYVGTDWKGGKATASSEVTG